MKDKLKNDKKIIIFAVCLIIIEIISLLIIKVFILDKKELLEIKNNNYEIRYSDEWKKNKSDDTGFILKNKDAQIMLDIKEIDEKDRYRNIEELHDDIVFNINSENKEYSYLAEEKRNITYNNYEGYQFLYETEKTNLLLKIFKDYDNIYIVTYEAKIDEFDYFLESAEDVIYSLTIVKDNVNLNLDHHIDLTNINLEKNEQIDNLINNTDEHTISSANYKVKFKVPSNFKTIGLSSKFYNGNFEGLDSGKTLNITFNIFNSNIISVLEKDSSFNIYAYDSLRNNDNFNEQLSKVSDKKYIYKYSYNNDNEVLKIINEIDKNHICIFEIKAYKTLITQKLVDLIDILDYENYAQNIDKTNTLKGVDFSNNITEVKFNIPDKYIQIDKENNIYESKNYVLNKNENNIYDYEIEICIQRTSPENSINNINSSIDNGYGIYNELKKVENKQYNGKKFDIYDGGTTLLSGTMFTNKNRKKYYQNRKVLFYKVKENQFIKITINGNEKEITNEIVNDFTNFNIVNN